MAGHTFWFVALPPPHVMITPSEEDHALRTASVLCSPVHIYMRVCTRLPDKETAWNARQVTKKKCHATDGPSGSSPRCQNLSLDQTFLPPSALSRQYHASFFSSVSFFLFWGGGLVAQLILIVDKISVNIRAEGGVETPSRSLPFDSDSFSLFVPGNLI